MFLYQTDRGLRCRSGICVIAVVYASHRLLPHRSAQGHLCLYLSSVLCYSDVSLRNVTERTRLRWRRSGPRPPLATAHFTLSFLTNYVCIYAQWRMKLVFVMIYKIIKKKYYTHNYFKSWIMLFLYRDRLKRSSISTVMRQFDEFFRYLLNLCLILLWVCRAAAAGEQACGPRGVRPDPLAAGLRPPSGPARSPPPRGPVRPGPLAADPRPAVRPAIRPRSHGTWRASGRRLGFHVTVVRPRWHWWHYKID